MNDFIYDLEIYPNIFTMAVKQAGVDNWWQFEISGFRFDHPGIVQFMSYLRSTSARMVGYNNLGFDYPILHFVIQNNPTCTEIYQHMLAVMQSSNNKQFGHIIWDRDQLVPQLDLYKIHHFDNVARATSLKVLEFNMKADSIQDLPFPPGTVLTGPQIEQLKEYNKHDVRMTEWFYNESREKIAFREELSVKYNRNFLNHNDTKIGKDYFIMELERIIPGFDRKQQTVRDCIRLSEVILPYVQFERPEFQRVRDWLYNQTLTETKGVFDKLHCIVDGFQYDFGTGGIHGSVESQFIQSTDTHEIIDLDVASYYPNLAIANRLYPLHLTEVFCDIYKDVYEQRKQHKKGSAENAMLKLALNGVYGDSNNQYSPFYDPQYTMSITINGQLLLCMLAEQLIKIPGLRVIQINTDGITVHCPRAHRDHLTAVCEWWQTMTRLELEEAVYGRMWIRDVNNYIAEKLDSKLKRKGAYEYQLQWHQNHSALVVPMAAEAAMVHGESVSDFILNHDVLHDFMLRAKVPRSSRLVLHTGNGDEPLQNVSRYYISKTGGSLVKIMPPLAKAPGKERRIGIDVGWLVTECNDIRQADPLQINMEYYIKQAEKLEVR